MAAGKCSEAMGVLSVQKRAHHPSDPLEVLLEVLVAGAVAGCDGDAAVVRAQQCCQAQGEAPGQFNLHTWVGIRQAMANARDDAWMALWESAAMMMF